MILFNAYLSALASLLNHSVHAPSLTCAMHVHEAVDEAITTLCPGRSSALGRSRRCLSMSLMPVNIVLLN